MIAREGVPFILLFLVVTAGLFWAAYRFNSVTLIVLCSITAMLTVFVTYFFRDPNTIPASLSPYALISPANGKVIGVERLQSYPQMSGEVIKVSIFLNVFDVHVNRVPVSGVVSSYRYNAGKFLAAFVDKASEENEQTEIGIKTADGRVVVVKQIAGLIARRIICRIKEGDRVTGGERFGMIRFGSRAELFFPSDSKVEVNVGDRVVGGETVIGFLAEPVNTNRTSNERSTNAQL